VVEQTLDLVGKEGADDNSPFVTLPSQVIWFHMR